MLRYVPGRYNRHSWFVECYTATYMIIRLD
jgi:hypothetical protein